MTYVWCELVCDNCAVTCSNGQFVSGSIIPKREMIRTAKKLYGWIFTRNELYCCQSCKDQHGEAR